MYNYFLSIYLLTLLLVVFFVAFFTVLHIVASYKYGKDLKALDVEETRSEKRKINNKQDQRKRYWYLPYKK